MIGLLLLFMQKSLNKILSEGQSPLAHGNQGVCLCPSLACGLSFLNSKPLTKGPPTLSLCTGLCLHPQLAKSHVFLLPKILFPTPFAWLTLTSPKALDLDATFLQEMSIFSD